MFEKWFENAKQVLSELGAKRTLKTLILWGSIAAVAIFLTFNWFIEFSAIAMVLIYIVIGFGALWAIDRFILSEINTVEEIKKGNMAHAILILAFAIVVAAAICAV